MFSRLSSLAPPQVNACGARGAQDVQSCRVAASGRGREKGAARGPGDQKVNAAQDILRFTPKRASGLISKVLKSAIANANEAEADVRKLYVTEARIDPGPYFRRWRPKDRGRAHQILKKTSHIIVVVEER